MEMKELPQEKIDAIKEKSELFHLLKREVSNVVVGNDDVILFITIAMLCNGHILLEGVPGVAKTTIIKTITQALGLSFKRIQFTPDLLPSDLIGTLVYNQKTNEFETKKGPIFANLILADEINRAPAKVQAALLEAMQEGQVTIGSTTYEIDRPFLVFATQNPIEQEGTYRLPEAQVDRFMFKIMVHYLTKEQEKNIIHATTQVTPIKQILDKQTLFESQKLVDGIYVDEKIVDYIINIIFATRTPGAFNLKSIEPYIQYGVSPRATMSIYHAAQAHAFISKRYFVTPDDVKAVCPSALRHRIPLTYEAEVEDVSSDQIISTILSTIPSP